MGPSRAPASRATTRIAGSAVAVAFLASCQVLPSDPGSGLAISRGDTGVTIAYRACSGDHLERVTIVGSDDKTVLLDASRGTSGALVTEFQISQPPTGWTTAVNRVGDIEGSSVFHVSVETAQRTAGELQVDAAALRPGLVASDDGVEKQTDFDKSAAEHCD